MDLLLGLDIGTTAVKAGVYDSVLQLVALGQSVYARGLTFPQPGWVEHDADDLWQGVVAAVRQAIAGATGKGRVVALSVSTQGGTTVLLDAAGVPLRPAISWMDTRARANEAHSSLSPALVYRSAGWWSESGLSLRHIAWLGRNEAATLARAARVAFVSDYVLAHMTGRYVIDPSNAAMTMLYDITQGDWSDELLAAAGIGRGRLSPLAASGERVGRLLPGVAAELGLSGNVVVGNGAHDQYCAALGAGVVQPGAMLISTGTAWVLLFAADRPVFDDQQVFHPGPHAVADRWGAISSIPSAGASVEWYVRQVQAAGRADASRDYGWLNACAAAAPAGARGLLFMPLLGGFYSAAGDGPVRGAWIGLTLGHAANEMARSLLEGVAYEVRRLVELGRRCGIEAATATMVGGATASPVWPQILADVLGLPLSLPVTVGTDGGTAAACRGAAVLAGAACGVFSDVLAGAALCDARGRVFTPQAANTRRYDDLYGVYCQAFSSLRGAFADLARLAG